MTRRYTTVIIGSETKIIHLTALEGGSEGGRW